MDRTAASFRTSDVHRGKLRDVLTRHFEYEQARTFRSTTLYNLAAIVTVVWTLSRGAHLLPDRALTLTLIVAVAGVAIVIVMELRAWARLLREIADIPTRSGPFRQSTSE